MDLITRLALIADPLLTVHNYSAADQIVEWWEFYFQLYVFLQLEHYCSTRSALLVSTCQPSAAGWLAKFRAVNCEMKNFRFASECWEILRAVGKIRAPGRKAMIFHVRLFRAVLLCCFVCMREGGLLPERDEINWCHLLKCMSETSFLDGSCFNYFRCMGELIDWAKEMDMIGMLFLYHIGIFLIIAFYWRSEWLY